MQIKVNGPMVIAHNGWQTTTGPRLNESLLKYMYNERAEKEKTAKPPENGRVPPQSNCILCSELETTSP